jgi:hypothetical protein
LLLQKKEVAKMKCEFSDGLTVSYTGPLQILKGTDVNVFIKEDRIPDDIKSDLDMALFRNRCSAMRTVAEEVTRKYGNRACVH